MKKFTKHFLALSMAGTLGILAGSQTLTVFADSDEKTVIEYWHCNAGK